MEQVRVELSVNNGSDTITVVETESGVFEVVEDSMTQGDDWIVDPTALGFVDWDGEVENLDKDSDGFQCFQISDVVRWNDVVLGTGQFTGPSIERVKEALRHVTITAWCPGDV